MDGPGERRARRVVLHVGAPKSGTTYLQSRLLANADALAADGVTVPLAGEAEGRGSLAFRAALDLTGKRMNRPREYAEGYWRRLVEQVAAAPGDVVVSHEAFVRCDAERIARATTELATGGHEVHVVYTARDLARALVSAWLEGLKHGTTRDLTEHVALARAGELPVARTLDPPRVAGAWAAALPPGRVHVVTLPPTGGDPDLLWTRFAHVAGFDPARAPAPATRANDAVGVPEAQLLLALNRRLGRAVARGGALHGRVSGPVAAALSGRDSPRVHLGPTDHAWAAEVAEAWVDWLAGPGADLGVEVVGEPADLRPRPAEGSAYVDVAEPHPGVADAAATAIAALLED